MIVTLVEVRDGDELVRVEVHDGDDVLHTASSPSAALAWAHRNGHSIGGVQVPLEDAVEVTEVTPQEDGLTPFQRSILKRTTTD